MTRLNHLLGFSAVVILLAAASSGCGDGGGDGGGDDSSPASTQASSTDQGCEDVPEFPVRASQEARGYVVACLTPDQTSVHLKNVSAHVLRVYPTTAGTRIQVASVEQDPGLQAALAVTGSGLVPGTSYFVLPLGGSLVASAPGPVVVQVAPDLALTAEASPARYVADWLASRLQTRGQRLTQTALSCASTAASFARTGAYFQDVLRGALGTAQCSNSLVSALRESGQTQDALHELPQVRNGILEIARPVAEDRLIAFAANVLGH